MTLHGPDKKESDPWLPTLHLSGLLLLIVPPILVWIWKRDKVEDIRRHAIDITNFQQSMTLYLIPRALLSIFPVLIVLGLFSQVITIINNIKVASNQTYRYPLSIKFLKPETFNKDCMHIKIYLCLKAPHSF